MASKQEKLRRKKLVKMTIKKVDESQLPISFENLAKLLNHIDEQLGVKACDDTLRMTIDYLKDLNLNYEEIVPWLNKYGAYCDCEIFNVEDAWERELESLLL